MLHNVEPKIKKKLISARQIAWCWVDGERAKTEAASF